MRHVVLVTAALLLGACNDTFSPSSPSGRAVPQLSANSRPVDPIPGQYIVVFRGDVLATESISKALAVKHNGKLKHTYKVALKGMAIELSDSAVAALRQDPAVAYVEQDQMAHLVTESVVQPGATSGLDRVDQRL